MDIRVLNDRNEFPDDAVLGKHLDKTKAVWDAFVARLAADFPAMTLEWRYYNDGKSWLCKLVHRNKTVCWISIWPKFFKVTHYFMDRHNKDIKALDIDQALKDAFLSKKSPGKLKSLTVDVKSKKALSSVFELVRYKARSQSRLPP